MEIAALFSVCVEVFSQAKNKLSGIKLMDFIRMKLDVKTGSAFTQASSAHEYKFAYMDKLSKFSIQNLGPLWDFSKTKKFYF